MSNMYSKILSIYIGVIILSGSLITIIGINEVFGQADNKEHILAMTSLNIQQLEGHLFTCEKSNKSESDNVEFAELCLEYLKDFNTKFSELRTENQKYFETLQK